MAELRRCSHPKGKVIAEWVEPDTVHEGSCFQWFHCEACGKHWRQERAVPLPRGTRLSDAPDASESSPQIAANPRRPLPENRLRLGWWSISLIFGIPALVLLAMLWFVFSGVFH